MVWPLSKVNLGNVYRAAGENEKARIEYEFDLELQEKALPSDHRDIARTLQNLAVVDSHLHDTIQAKEYFERAEQTAKRTLWEKHRMLALLHLDVKLDGHRHRWYHQLSTVNRTLICLNCIWLAIKFALHTMTITLWHLESTFLRCISPRIHLCPAIDRGRGLAYFTFSVSSFLSSSAYSSLWTGTMEGQHVLIIGAAGGIGWTLGRVFLEQWGANVSLHYNRTVETLAPLLDQYKDRWDVISVNATDEEVVQQGVEESGARVWLHQCWSHQSMRRLSVRIFLSGRCRWINGTRRSISI